MVIAPPTRMAATNLAESDVVIKNIRLTMANINLRRRIQLNNAKGLKTHLAEVWNALIIKNKEKTIWRYLNIEKYVDKIDK